MISNIISENNFEKARRKIRESKTPIIFSSDDDELNRKVLEKEKIDILLLSQRGRKDYQKQRNSGLNQVMAKIAKKNNVTIGINLDEIVESKNKEKADILSRIKQNVMLCKKNKLNMTFLSPSGKNKRNEHDIKSLGLVLAMPTNMIKNIF